MPRWASLFVQVEVGDAVVGALTQTGEAHGYAPYDTFAGVLGKSYPAERSLRLFVQPPEVGWTRVLISPDTPLPNGFASALSRVAFTLSLALEGGKATLIAFEQGEVVDVPPSMTPQQDIPNAEDPVTALLPSMASKHAVDSRQAQTLMNRLSANAMHKVGGDMAAAQELLQNSPSWGSEGGRSIAGVAAAMRLPQHWHTPDFATVRDAYQLHRRRAQRPNAPFYPGDAETMAAVPNAFDYLPVYLGREK